MLWVWVYRVALVIVKRGTEQSAMSDKKRKRDKAGKDAGIQEADLVKLKDFMAEEDTKLRTDVIDRI